MRVILWGINYTPELTGIAPFNAGLCDYLRERGHDVEMCTAFPYYPFWKKIPGDKGLVYRSDDIDGVLVHRCWNYVPSRVTPLRRILHEFSFGLFSFLRLLFISRPDLYVVVSPPLILGPLAWLLGLIKRRPYVFHVQDLQPDAAVGLGMVKQGLFTRLLYRVEAWSYRCAAFVSGISEGMMAAYRRKGVPEEKRVLFPNWIRLYGRNAGVSENRSEQLRRATAFRRKFNIPGDVFVASYSGNIGKKQGLETLIQAADQLRQTAMPSGNVGRGEAVDSERETRSGTRGKTAFQSGEVALTDATATTLTATARQREVLILIVGDGAARVDLEALTRDLRLANVRMMPLLVEADYQGLLAASDVSLVLQAPRTGQYFFPSKLLSILAAGSPVVSVADEDSELAKAVRDGKFGVNVLPARPKELAEALAGLADDAARLGELRRHCDWVEHFSGERVLGAFEARLRSTTGKL